MAAPPAAGPASGPAPGPPSTPATDPATDPAAVRFRIGEVAKILNLTTRTLRYWEELGLVSPYAHGGGGERLYSRADLARAERVRDLQKLLGFSLAEVRVVLETEGIDVLIQVKSEFRAGEPSGQRRRELYETALAANERLVGRLDETLARIAAFRAERAGSAERVRAALRAMDAAEATPATAPRPPSS
jgi:DNA-binding transcriptional MerR regulator